MSATQIPDISVDFIDNSDQRTLCVLILDGSGSMSGQKIDALNAGLVSLQKSLSKDTVARGRVRLLILRVGDDNAVTVESDWTDAINFVAPTIEANGTTPLGGALNLAMDKIDEEKNNMKNAGVAYTRPLVWIITDGEPTDMSEWESAARRSVSYMRDKKIQVYCIGVEVSDLNPLKMTQPGAHILQLANLDFSELFNFLSASVSSVSKATPGTDIQVAVPPTLMPFSA
jgi:uncharacterized protein YegL